MVQQPPTVQLDKHSDYLMDSIVVTQVTRLKRYHEQFRTRFANVIPHGFIIRALGLYQMICHDELIPP